jgi:soluble lytic murein transglycosylase-like protein
MQHPWDQIGRAERRASRLRTRLAALGGLLGGAAVFGTLAALLTGLSAANPPRNPGSFAAAAEVTALRTELDDTKGRLALAEVRIDRMTAIAKYSGLYKVPADLAGAIYDIALAEGIHPSLGFQLVKVESGFKAGARSDKGAIGYAQVRLKTARGYDPSLTERDLHDRDTNLRIGFRFLKEMLGQFDQDLQMALLAYNRGPGRVVELISRGEDPSNGYAQSVMKGVRKGS